TARQFTAFVIEHKGKFLVQQRPAGVVNGHLWEFPNFETTGVTVEAGELFKTQFKVVPPELTPMRTVKHSITRYRITLQTFHVRVKKNMLKTGGTWFSPKELDSLAFSSAHKKLASAAAKSILSDR
ncbi:MAG TPA: NUDIX domain-containing protein, partial [Verrucomicrobiae bacterium]|nr:NUDIX domain-containing protein [Verrucomicrobiae bacterium]